MTPREMWWLVLLFISVVSADRGQTCTCSYEFPEVGGAYAVAECTLDTLVGNFTKSCQCPDVSNPLLNNVTTACPGKTALTGLAGFSYNSRTMCTRLMPPEVTKKPIYLLECEGASCGGAQRAVAKAKVLGRASVRAPRAPAGKSGPVHGPAFLTGR